MLKGVFPCYEDFDSLPLERPRWWVIGVHHTFLPVLANKKTHLFVFVKSEDVDFALLRVMGPVAASCVDCVMTILSLPLLTCTTWVLLGGINEVEINLLTKKIKGREVPPGMLEICTHKFCKLVLQCKQNNNKKKNANKIFIKIKNIVGSISNIIFFRKEYFPSDSFTLTTTWRKTMTFSWFQRVIECHNWLIPEWTCWMAKNACQSSFTVYRTCREIWWSFFF